MPMQAEDYRPPLQPVNTPLMLHVEPRKRKRRKWLYRVMWGLVAILAGSGTYWWWNDRQALLERDALIAELRARGEPVYWDEVADKLLRARDDGTGAELYMQALWALGGELNRNGPRVVSSNWELAHQAERNTPAIRPELQKELALGAPALALLEKAVRRPPGLLTTALKTEDPFSILLPHVQDGRNLARFLHWHANDALARGDVKGAYHAVWLSVKTSEQLKVEPFAVAQLVRFAIRGEAYGTLAMCLEHAPPPEEDFRAIDAALAEVDDGFGVEGVWHSERSLWMTTLEKPQAFKEAIRNFGTSGRANSFQDFVRLQWSNIVYSPLGRPVMRRTQAALLRLSERMAGTLDRPMVDPALRNAAFDEFERDEALGKLGVGVDDWGFRTMNSFDLTCEKAHRRCVLARLALRLRRFYDQKGRFPEKLDELCDREMPRLRLDWFRNAPLVYTATKAGFRLEVPEAILTKDELRRKRDKPNDAPDVVLNVEIKSLKAPASR